MLQTFFALKISSILSWFFGYEEKRLVKKAKRHLFSDFMISKSGQQIITIHILSNTFSSKGNQTIIFGWLK